MRKVSLMMVLSCFYINAQTNVVIIESDDQSNQAVGAYGNLSMKTPNIDRLAEEGVSFTAAYNMGCWSPAVCIPSRTMLFYGQSLWKSQKISKKNSPKPLPEIFRENGYRTYMTGKWHAMGKRPSDIFDEIGSIQVGQLDTYFTEKGHVTDITGNEAVKFINDYKDDKPFFMYVAFNAPHVPRQTEQKYYDMYPTSAIMLPPSVIDNGPLNPNIEYNYTSAPMKVKTMKSRVQQNNAMVTHMDDRIGDILKAIKEKGIYDNTIIVFMSDHGISFGENGVAGKVCLYEPSVTAPLIIKAPKIKPDSKVKDRVYLQDINPTILDLLDIEIANNIDFQSLVPLIDKTGKARPSIYLAMFDDQRGLVSHKDKLILYPKSGAIEYYDLKDDPWETKNLVNLKNKRTTIKKLLKDLQLWQKRVGDTVNLSKPYKQFLD